VFLEDKRLGCLGVGPGRWGRGRVVGRWHNNKISSGRRGSDGGGGAVANRRGRPLRKASESDRDEVEDTMAGAASSNPSPSPAAADRCIEAAPPSTQTATPMTNHTDAGSTCTRVQAQGYGPLVISWAIDGAGPRTSLLSLPSWLLPSSYISTSLDLHLSLVTYMYLPFPTSFTAYQPDRLSRLPTLMLTLFHVDRRRPAYIHLLRHFTSLHSCLQLRTSVTHLSVHPIWLSTSTFNVQLVASTRTRR